ncbi:MAG: hypothetical protein R3B06_02065 [Kofleriaceae bacterium]
MLILRHAALLAVVAACGQPRATPATPALGYRGNLDEAAAHEREAEAHERAAEAARGAPDSYACGDRALSEQSRSGTEPVTTWVPCWSVERDASAAHAAEAARLRAEAREHRAIARSLLEVERTFCANLPADELTHTPLYHRSDVAQVAPYRADGQLVGAQITFRHVDGLTADWLRQSLLCHQARMATLGYPATYMGYDPAMLRGVHVAVTDADGTLTITVRADDDVTAAVTWSRAQALVGATP